MHDVDVAIDRQSADDHEPHIGVDGVDDVAVWIGAEGVEYDNIRGESCLDAPCMFGPANGIDDVRGDCLNQFVITEDIAHDILIPPIGSLQFVHRTLRARRPPIRADHDVDTLSLGGRHIGRVAV